MLWERQAITPKHRRGEPRLEEIHTLRQRRAMLWLADDDATSWATVDYDGHQTDTFRVSQHGPRRLWDAVEAAHRSWEAAGRPSVARYGLTVMPDGTATASLNLP